MAFDAVASDSPTTIPDRRAASVQHGVGEQPRGGCELARFRSARRRSEPRDTFGPNGECLESWRKCRAPEGESARSYKQTLSLNLNE